MAELSSTYALTIDPSVTKDFVPVISLLLGVLHLQHKQLPMSPIREYDPRPMPREGALSCGVWLLSVDSEIRTG